MATSPKHPPAAEASCLSIPSLAEVASAAHRLHSILDLDALIEAIVEHIAGQFGCVETGILLVDEHSPDHLILAGVRGCTQSEKGARYRIGQEGLVGLVAATRKTVYVPDVSANPHYIPCEPETESEVDIPLLIGDELIGVFEVSCNQLDGFAPEHIQVLETLATHIATAVHNARRFRREQQLKFALERQQEEARAMQQALLPPPAPSIPNFMIDARCVPAQAVSGDWYDYFRLPDGRWAIVLADVAGKGMAAALLMSSTRAVLRSFAAFGHAPAEVLSHANRVLIGDLPAGRYVTLIYGVLDPEKRDFTFANAGHLPPVFVNGSAYTLDCDSGLPLGITEAEYRNHSVTLKDHDALLLYTDGITEACPQLSEEEFGVERLLERARESELTADSLLHCVYEYAGCNVLQDDATVMVLRGREGQAR